MAEIHRVIMAQTTWSLQVQFQLRLIAVVTEVHLLTSEEGLPASFLGFSFNDPTFIEIFFVYEFTGCKFYYLKNILTTEDMVVEKKSTDERNRNNRIWDMRNTKSKVRIQKQINQRKNLFIASQYKHAENKLKRTERSFAAEGCVSTAINS